MSKVLTVTSLSVAFRSTIKEPGNAFSAILVWILLKFVNCGGNVLRLTFITNTSVADLLPKPKARLPPSTAYSRNYNYKNDNMQ